MGDCSNLADLTGKTVVITGGNSGIGKATAAGLARLGARVVITARNPQRGDDAVADIKRQVEGAQVEWLSLDLSRLQAVRDFAKELLDRVDRIDVLDLNAGGVLSRRQLSDDGYELQFQANHLAHFLLTDLLLERLRASAPSRIIVVSSGAHAGARRGLDFSDLQWERRRYQGFRTYQHTKLMNVYFTRELARRLDGTGVTVNAMHPGFVATAFGKTGDTRLLGLGTALVRPFARSPEKGAETVVWLAASPDVEGVSGRYFFNCADGRLSKAALDDGAALRLWEISERLTA